MLSTFWQLHTPMQAVVFDCDGTLSRIEGIDELAKQNNVGEKVCNLTATAMGNTGIDPDIYRQRLELVKPTYNQVMDLANLYFAQQTPDGAEVIQIFKRLQKSIYLMSAGLYPAVARFGELLQIPRENIFAVDIEFDSQGRYVDFDNTSPLTQCAGKKTLVQQLKTIHSEIIYMGDGLNDLAVYENVARFIGFGGAYFHKKVAEKCQFYIKTTSMAALLPLSLTATESQQLTESEQNLYKKGLTDIEAEKVVIKPLSK